jgi:hypothetical protein
VEIWKRSLGKPRHRWEGNITIDIEVIRYEGVNWIKLAKDRLHYQTFVNMVIS